MAEIASQGCRSDGHFIIDRHAAMHDICIVGGGSTRARTFEY